jgi:hypothetical protein
MEKVQEELTVPHSAIPGRVSSGPAFFVPAYDKLLAISESYRLRGKNARYDLVMATPPDFSKSFGEIAGYR